MSAALKPENEIKVEDLGEKSPGTSVAHRAGGQIAEIPEASAMVPDSIISLLDKAVSNGLPVESLERLVALHDRIAAAQAEKLFAAALAKFQSECPSPRRTKTASIVSERTGSKYSFNYSPRDEIMKTIRPHLAANGFSVGFDRTQTADYMTVTCTLRHSAGHKVTSTATVPMETKSGMSAQQKVGNADSYGERITLSSVLGIVTTDAEEDAKSTAHATAKITDDQATTINDLAKETGTEISRILKFAQVDKLSDILGADYPQIIEMLEKKREKKP